MTKSKFFDKKTIALIISAVVILALMIVALATDGINNLLDCPDCVVAGSDCDTCGGEGQVIGSAWALLPPVIAIGLALITKEVYSSLFIGILSGSLIIFIFSEYSFL